VGSNAYLVPVVWRVSGGQVALTGISEFTFGYAFLFEQTHKNWQGLSAAPVLPSLQKEADEGWDAHLPTNGTDFYYQFKLSDYLWRRNAKYIQDGTYQAPYYRISLHRRENNRQHQRLRSHSHHHVHTYYVAPEFSGLTQFNSSFLARQITDASRLIPVNQCQDITDGDQHYISFQTGDQAWHEHSERRSHEYSETGKTIESLYRKSQEEWKTIDRGFAEHLYDLTSNQVREDVEAHRQRDRTVTRLLEPPVERSRISYLARVADLLSIFYGVTLVIVGEGQQ